MALEEKLQHWIIHETTALSEGRMKAIPDIAAIKKITENKKNREILKYVISHVKSKHKVDKIRKVLNSQNDKPSNQNLLDNKAHLTNIKQEIAKAEQKLQFEENTLKVISKEIATIKEEIQNLKKSNCVILQKCTFLNLNYINYKEKENNLKTILEKLISLITKTFSLENLGCFQNLAVFRNLEDNKTEFYFQSVDKNIQRTIFQMSIALEKGLNEKDENKYSLNCINSMNDAGYISMINFIAVLKQLSSQSESALKENSFLLSNKTFKDDKLYNKYMQEMKLGLTDSFFSMHKSISNTNKLKANEIFDSNSEEIVRWLTIKDQNEGIKQSIEFLEDILNIELDRTKQLVEENSIQRHKCKDLKDVMQEFHNKVQFILIFLNTTSKFFNDISKALISSNEQLHNFSIITEDECYFSDVRDKMKNDYKSSLAILKSKNFLKNLHHLNFENKVSDRVWNLLEIGYFQNQSVLLEKVVNLKQKASVQEETFVFQPNEKVIEILKEFAKSIEGNLEELKGKEDWFKTNSKKGYKNLEIALNEWWHQNAQFIPSITYDNKSLKMWLDILHVLDVNIL